MRKAGLLPKPPLAIGSGLIITRPGFGGRTSAKNRKLGGGVGAAWGLSRGIQHDSGAYKGHNQLLQLILLSYRSLGASAIRWTIESPSPSFGGARFPSDGACTRVRSHTVVCASCVQYIRAKRAQNPAPRLRQQPIFDCAQFTHSCVRDAAHLGEGDLIYARNGAA